MKKEIDTYKLAQLFDVFKNAMLWGWYSSAVIIAVSLWYFQLPSSRIQTFVFLGIFCWYTILSVAISKVDRIRGEIE